MKVPFIDLQAQHQALAAPLREAFDAVMAECGFIGGKRLRDFEHSFAAEIGSRRCLGVANGTDALTIALRAAGIGPGDKVITAANSFIATAEAISAVGAQPSFVDCCIDSFLMDLDLAAKAVCSRTKAIIPVHLFGAPVNMDAVCAMAATHGLTVVADCAQAHGAQWQGRHLGGFGHAACYSFYPGKILGACGDGGAICTNEIQFDHTARLIANHGSDQKHRHPIIGQNSRLDSLQAAFLSVKLPFLRSWVQARRNAAAHYNRRLQAAGLAVPSDPPGGLHAYHLYVVRVPNRAHVAATLADAGIDCGIHYPTALPFLPAYAYLGHRPEDFPRAGRLQDEILSLPIYPEITPEQIDHVCDRLTAAVFGET
jgi:dTDP-4-amino-4,6-dideoxygalactose transaminase